jgi:DNA invertase Pin-like site-specific DNA recombinase
MNILYVRVSSIDQNLDRQKSNQDYKLIVEDKCSGSIPFFDREGGKQIQKYFELGILGELHVWEIDRLGRNLRDILNTIHFFSEKNIPVVFLNQGLRTIDIDGNENPIAKLMISILATVGEMERNQSKERQKEGIRIAKLKGVYKGRKQGSNEDLISFLNKEKNKKAIDYMKKGYKNIEISKIVKIHINTLTKVKLAGEQLGVLPKMLA